MPVANVVFTGGKHPDAAKTRQRYVLGQMVERGFIERKAADKVAAEPIRLAREPLAARGMAAEAVDMVARTLGERGERAGESGVTVQTTIDARLQELARTSVVLSRTVSWLVQSLPKRSM